ncbi:MAG: cytochrome c biogenesis CcdA family protein [Alphaproteobacteria bacterium]
MLDVSFGAAFIAGLLSFVSPCVLPIVPPYLCFLAGVSLDEINGSDTEAVPPGTSRRVFISALAFVLGFSTVFVILGATASIFGQALREALSWTIAVAGMQINVIASLAGLAIMVMGLHFLGLFRIGLLYREARVQVDRAPTNLWGAYGIGLAFAFGWTPCIGPVLAAILAVAGTEESVARGASLLSFYAAGIGLPFLAAAAFSGPFLRWAARFRQHMATVEKVMGGLLVVTGVLFMTGQMAAMAYWLLETFPVLAEVG